MPIETIYKEKDTGFLYSMPEKLLTVKNYYAHFFFAIGILFILGLCSYNISAYLTEPKVLGVVTESSQIKALEEEKAFWEEFVSENPNYIDGWIRLSKVLQLLGDFDYAEGAYNTAYAIDPNSDKLAEAVR